MPLHCRLTIGGIELRVSSAESLAVATVGDPRYLEFIDPVSPPKSLDAVSIELTTASPPSPDAPVMFTGDAAWTIRGDNDLRQLIFHPPAFTAPVWVADFPTDAAHCTVHLGKDCRIGTNRQAPFVNPVTYPLDLNLIMYRLAARDGLIIHAAAVVIEGRGWLFPGRSGAGKSTLAAMCSRILGQDSELSEDRVIFRVMDGIPWIYGTPWLGSGAIHRNRACRLHAIAFPVKSTGNRIRSISPANATERIMPTLSVPWYDEYSVSKLLPRVEALVAGVPVFDMEFNRTDAILPLMVRKSQALA